MLAAAFEGDSQLEKGVRVLRVQPNGILQGDNRLVQFAGLRECQALVEGKLGIFGAAQSGAVIQGGGLIKAANLEVGRAKIIACFDVFRGYLQRRLQLWHGECGLVLLKEGIRQHLVCLCVLPILFDILGEVFRGFFVVLSIQRIDALIVDHGIFVTAMSSALVLHRAVRPGSAVRWALSLGRCGACHQAQKQRGSGNHIFLQDFVLLGYRPVLPCLPFILHQIRLNRSGLDKAMPCRL